MSVVLGALCALDLPQLWMSNLVALASLLVLGLLVLPWRDMVPQDRVIGMTAVLALVNIMVWWPAGAGQSPQVMWVVALTPPVTGGVVMLSRRLRPSLYSGSH